MTLVKELCTCKHCERHREIKCVFVCVYTKSTVVNAMMWLVIKGSIEMKTFSNRSHMNIGEDMKSRPKRHGTCYFLPKCHLWCVLLIFSQPTSHTTTTSKVQNESENADKRKEEIIRFLLFFHLNEISMIGCDVYKRAYSTHKHMHLILFRLYFSITNIKWSPDFKSVFVEVRSKCSISR